MNDKAKVKPGDDRPASDGTHLYRIKDRAPDHYIGGHGVVKAGAVVRLPKGVKPGKYLEAVKPSAKAGKVAEQVPDDSGAAGEF